MVIPDHSDLMRLARGPFLCRCRFAFVFGLNEKVMCISGQLRDIAHIFEWRFHIEKQRLIIGIYRVKRLVAWHNSVNLRGGLFYLVPVF